MLFDIGSLQADTQKRDVLVLPETAQTNTTKAPEPEELLGAVSTGAASQQCSHQQGGFRALLFTLQAAVGWK